jgi:hypothetical protein
MKNGSIKLLSIMLTVLLGLSTFGLERIISMAYELNVAPTQNEAEQIDGAGAAGEPQAPPEQGENLIKEAPPEEVPEAPADAGDGEYSNSNPDEGNKAPDNSGDPEHEGQINGFIWLDGDNTKPTDWDGLYNEENRAPIEGVTVYLYVAEGLWNYWALEPDEQRLEVMPRPFASAQTDEDGSYVFERLSPNYYIAAVAQELINGKEYLPPVSFTADNKFAIDINNELLIAFSEYIALGEGQIAGNINAGVRLPDANTYDNEEESQGEDALPGEEELPVEEEQPGGESGGGISGFVWIDGDGTTETCWDGLYDGHEQPLVGCPVYLFAAGDLETPIAIEETENDGTFSFGGLPAGEYALMIDAGFYESIALLPPLALTEYNRFMPDESTDSSKVYTEVIALNEGEWIENIDAGMRIKHIETEKGSISGSLWMRSGESGIFKDSEDSSFEWTQEDIP